MDPFARGDGRAGPPSGDGDRGGSGEWGWPEADEPEADPAGAESPGGDAADEVEPAEPGGLGDPPPDWHERYAYTPAGYPSASAGVPSDPGRSGDTRYESPGYGFPFYPPPPPPRRGARAAMVATAVVACVALLALGVAGGVGAAFYLRHQTTPIAGRQRGLPGQSRAGAVDLPNLATRLDPSIVDITGVKQDATGQTVEDDAGTGVIVSRDGQVLTNNHVIEGDAELKAVLDSGRTYPLKVLGEDPTDDVALVQIEGGPKLPAVDLRRGARASMNEAVAAFGNALGRGGRPAATQGRVTNLDQTITASLANGTSRSETLSGLIEMSAQICPGDSGGMLANSAGQYLGILTAASTGGNQGPGYGNGPGSGEPGNGEPGHGEPGHGEPGHGEPGGSEPGNGGGGNVGGSGADQCSSDGFAIPAAHAIPIVKQIRSGRRSSKVIIGVPGFLGVEVEECTQTSAQQGSCQAPSVDGAEITQLVEGGAAQNAGLPQSFVITAIGETPVTSPSDLTTALQQTTPGQIVRVTWNDGQGGDSQTTPVTLATGPPA